MCNLDYKDLSYFISNKLEKLIKEKKVKTSAIAKEIGMNLPNFSKNRNKLKKGELPSIKFILGITYYFNENFLN